MKRLTKMDKHKIISGVVWSFAERVSAQIVQFLVSIVLARILLPEDYGILALVNVFIVVANALAVGGFGTALVQKKDSNETDFNSILWLSIAISVILYLLLFVTAPFISVFYEEESLTLIIRVLGLRLIFSAINSIQLAYIQKTMQFKRLFLVSILTAVFSGVAGIVVAIYGMGVWALILQQLLYVVLNTGFLVAVTNWKPKFICSRKSIKTMWGFGSKVFLVTIVDTFNDNIRSLVIGKVFTESDLAYYNQGKRFPQLLVADGVESLSKVLLPALSQQQDNIEKNKQLMRNSIRISSFILLPMIFGLIGVADVFIELLLTEKWMPCVPFLRILSLMYINRSLSSIMKNSLLAIGKSEINLFHDIITTILTILLIFASAFYWQSIELIAWSYVFVALVDTSIYSYFVVREYRYKIKEITRDYIPSLMLALSMALVVYIMNNLPLPLMIKLVLQILVGMTVYLGGAKLFKLQEYRYISNIIKRTLNRNSR